MASEVDIVNLALGHLGDDGQVQSISPPDGSPQAYHSAKFYPIARDAALDEQNWGFATVRDTLNKLNVTPASGWKYAYAIPSDCLSPVSIFISTATDDSNPQQFEVETLPDLTPVIYSNVDSAILKYIRRVTDTTKFSPIFVDALAWLLASFLAGPLLKGATGVQAAKQAYVMYNERLRVAAGADGVERKVDPTHSVPWMSGR